MVAESCRRAGGCWAPQPSSPGDDGRPPHVESRDRADARCSRAPPHRAWLVHRARPSPLVLANEWLKCHVNGRGALRPAGSEPATPCSCAPRALSISNNPDASEWTSTEAGTSPARPRHCKRIERTRNARLAVHWSLGLREGERGALEPGDVVHFGPSVHDSAGRSMGTLPRYLVFLGLGALSFSIVMAARLTDSEHGRQSTSRLRDEPPSRIVSLLPAATDILVALGAGDRLVARTTGELPESGLLDAGNPLDPSLEVIARTSPDLIVTWPQTDLDPLRGASPEGSEVLPLEVPDAGRPPQCHPHPGITAGLRGTCSLTARDDGERSAARVTSGPVDGQPARGLGRVA